MASKTLERALDRFRDGLTEEQRDQFRSSSIDDVKAEVQSIQTQLGSMKKLRSLRRISKFLEAMGQIEQLVQVFLNVSNVVGFIWGPIKLVLIVATAHVESLECLLDTYVEVGEVIPSLRQYDQLFKSAPCVLEVLEKYFYDILEFHRNALDVFARPAWLKWFGTTWKTFRTKFKPILESLKRHRELLHDMKADAAVLEIQTTRSQTLDLLQKSSDQSQRHLDVVRKVIEDVYEKLSSQVYDLRNSLVEQKANEKVGIHLQELTTIISKLDPPDADNDQHAALNSCHQQSGRWVFEHSTYLKWSKSKALPESVLFIHGMPGAGKTLLASRIVSHLTSLPGMTCLFFYFKHSVDTKTSMNHMLRSLLAQLIIRDAGLVPELFEKCCMVSTTEARQSLLLKTWMSDLIKSQSTCTIVLDGLDECNHRGIGNEARQILDWITDTIIPDATKEGSRIRLLALGQRDGVVDSALSKYPSIRLDALEAHLSDIKMFTKHRALEMGERFELQWAEEQSMFLYAKVVMDNLMAQGSAAELELELEAKFPNGLEEAYERVAYRVLDNPARPQGKRDATTKVLHWVTCAAQPLKWNEIQCMFCIDPYTGTCNTKNRRVDSCKSLCGSFVEADEDDPKLPQAAVVNLVHETARRYLIQSQRVDLLEAHARMALFSSAYLSSVPFEEGLTRKSIMQNALIGYYGLQDYMVSSWESHLIYSLDQSTQLAPETSQSLLHVLVKFLARYRLDIPHDHINDRFDRMTYLMTNESLANLTECLEEISSAIRKITEEIHIPILESRERSIFISLNGRPGYKCPKLKCLMFSQSFASKKVRDSHVDQHYNPFICSVSGCLRQTLGFTTLNALQNHVEKVHPSTAQDLNTFPKSETPKDICDAARIGDINFIQDFHRQGGDLNEPKAHYYSSQTKRGDRPIRIAARHGQLEVCQYLVQSGCSIFHAGNPNYPAKTALGGAVETRNVKCFDLLLSLAPKEEIAEYINGKALVENFAAAVNSGAPEIIDVLSTFLSSRETPIPFDIIFREIATYTPMKDANTSYVQKALLAVVEKLGSWEQLSDSRSKGGQSFLHRACLGKNPNVLLFLLQYTDPKEIHSKDRRGRTPIFSAVHAGVVECARLLLHHGGAKVMDDDDVQRNSPLHAFYHSGCFFNKDRVELLKVILPHSLHRLNDRNRNGDSPLHLACKHVTTGIDDINVIQLLLDTNVIDLTVRNNEDKTVFDMTDSQRVLSILHSAKKQEEDTTNSDRPLSPSPHLSGSDLSPVVPPSPPFF
ncbi:hypothetical protein F5Y16DRAFT_422846 [Xylariaceae sp. FL0255]|nr:hypothetical protein F5Y16DRAFT_422846 [Xylariaceae sp. FL0255]